MWFLLVAAAAHAGELTWKWSSEPVRYHAETLITTHLGYHYYGMANLDARAVQTLVAVDYTCKGEDGGKIFRVTCSVDDASLRGTAVPGEQDKLDQILAEYGELLRSASLQIEARKDGHIRLVDLEGVSKDQQRYSVVHEQLRQLLRRTLAPFSVQMPKEGHDGSKPWKHKGTPLAFDVGSSFGTAGGSAYHYELKGELGGDPLILGSGRANVSSGTELESSGSLAMNLVVTGQTRWDSAAGQPAYSEVAMTGQATASTVSVGPQDRYAMAGWIGRVRPDGTYEALQPGAAPPTPAEEPPERIPTTDPAAPDILAPPTPAVLEIEGHGEPSPNLPRP